METHFITWLAGSKALASVARGRPVGSRHCLQLMSHVTFMVNQETGSIERISMHIHCPNKVLRPYSIAASKHSHSI